MNVVRSCEAQLRAKARGAALFLPARGIRAEVGLDRGGKDAVSSPELSLIVDVGCGDAARADAA
jgi:hypothetical protein